MKRILILALIVLLAGCEWFNRKPVVIQDPAAEAIKSVQLNLDPLPPMDLEQYQPAEPPLYIKKPGPGTKFEVDLDWLEKHEKLLIELQNRIYIHQNRDAINKELFEKTKKLGEKPDQ